MKVNPLIKRQIQYMVGSKLGSNYLINQTFEITTKGKLLSIEQIRKKGKVINL